MSSTWGRYIRLSLFGESHGVGVGGVLDGLPAGIKIDEDFLSEWMLRRTSRTQFGTARRESDEFEILSGVYKGRTTGSPVAVLIRNKAHGGDEAKYSVARPSHSDYPAYKKNDGFNDIRGGGHYSARLTAPLTFFGGIVASRLAEKQGLALGSHVLSVGDKRDRPFNPMGEDKELLSSLGKKLFPVINPDAEQEFSAVINSYRATCDTIGGEIECIAENLPVGKGGPIFEGVDSLIASLVFAIPSVKSLEFGAVNAWRKNASAVNDVFCEKNGEISFATNNSGGLLGGFTSGAPLLFRVGMKPIPSLSRVQSGADLLSGKVREFCSESPSDCNQLIRSCVIVESATALAIAEAFEGKI